MFRKKVKVKIRILVKSLIERWFRDILSVLFYWGFLGVKLNIDVFKILI